MNATLEPQTSNQAAAAPPPPAAMVERLAALAAGGYDQDAFLREVDVLVQAAPDEACEILSVIDQYYRRGKIRQDVYQRAKSYLGGLLVGKGHGASALVALPPPHDRAPVAQVTVPVTAAAPRPKLPAARVPGLGDILRGRYRLTGIVGRGGMGTVFEAVDRYIGGEAENSRRLAIKVLHTEVTQRPELLHELFGEFQHLQSLSHPNIVRVHEFDRDGDTAFFTMELLHGVSLGRLLCVRGARSLPRAHARAIVRDVAAALAHAHSRGVVHGDINPQNIFLTDDGEIRVLDFGASHRQKSGASTAQLNLEEQILVATPRYASCEVLEGQAPEMRDDLFALACVAHVLLSGQHPFGNRTAIQARTALLRPARPPGLTAGQWHALRDGLDCRRDRRPSDVAEWLRRLNAGASIQPLPMLSALLTVPPRRRRTALLAALGAALMLLAAGGVWLANRGERLIELGAALSAQMRPTLGDARADARALIVRAWERVPATPGSGGEAAAKPGARATLSRVHAARLAPARARPSPRPAVPRAAPRRAVAAARARISMAAAAVDVLRASPFARVVVRRTGDPRSDVSFTWRTKSGTAKAGRDFAQFRSQVVHIEAGKRSVDLLIPIVTDSTRTEAENFYVMIDASGRGAQLAGRTMTMVTIPAAR
ncbi:MAG TPA: protein kinase [Steroidobacteraceae bacterium]|nr:protein kinase [Steroidobacteraceae bacterium]